jgi:hypothetical protein
MITPDTIENVSAPNFTGKWLICKLYGYGYYKIVLAKTEEAFKKSVLKCAWDVGSPGDDGMFTFPPYEIVVVSFPKERVSATAKIIEKEQFDSLKREVLWLVKRYIRINNKLPSGFQETKPETGGSVLLKDTSYGEDEKPVVQRFWFVGTKKKFQDSFKCSENNTPDPRAGSPSKAPPGSGGLYAVALDTWNGGFDIVSSYNEPRSFCPSARNKNIKFWFQKIQERPEIAAELIKTRPEEIETREEQKKKKREEQDRVAVEKEKKNLAKFFGGE